MKSLILAAAVFVGLSALSVSEADAFVWVAGHWRAGCITPRGGFGIGPRGYAYGYRGHGYGYHGWGYRGHRRLYR